MTEHEVALGLGLIAGVNLVLALVLIRVMLRHPV